MTIAMRRRPAASTVPVASGTRAPEEDERAMSTERPGSNHPASIVTLVPLGPPAGLAVMVAGAPNPEGRQAHAVAGVSATASAATTTDVPLLRLGASPFMCGDLPFEDACTVEPMVDDSATA